MTTHETIDKIKNNLEEIENKLKIVTGVGEEIPIILEVIRHSTDHLISLLRDHNVDAEKYRELGYQQQQQRILMQKLFPIYFYLNQGVSLDNLNQGVSLDNSMMDIRVLP
jgi:hypothetical protein